MLNILNMDIRVIISIIFAIVTAMTINEFCHALAAKRLGDDSKEIEDRLTLNPLAHISVLGFVALILVGFGWAKPVNANISRFKNKKKGKIIFAFSGLIGNFILALLSALVIKFIVPNSFLLNILTSGDRTEIFSGMMLMFFKCMITYNVMFLVFNVLPIPPLDGSIIYESILRGKAYEFYMKYAQWGQFILLFLVFTGLISFVLTPLIKLVITFIAIITGLNPSLLIG